MPASPPVRHRSRRAHGGGLSDVVRFRSASELEAEREREDLRHAALCLIEELGDQAGYLTALVARLPRLAPDARERLLAIVDAIEQEQGFGWCFGDAEQAAQPAHKSRAGEF